ncbi:hypothetical protein LTR70_007915 [Exophiala xenobiotica]|uniref:Alpha/beta hydrolase fold-3 domain-containing protein n=1 Tax=Lithohypha guttulata TaxID=1690604 RepID=A0ABR0KA71_9EURO|nr:hypothetical protein LTR24_005591 [Lithohypha guttulata]KAK5312920.1 hypothetical protein LTR70_007915 [Exophiala xenobiotica]
MHLPPIHTWFHPTLSALLTPNIPLNHRVRLLLFQPLVFLIYALNAIPSALSRRATTLYIPVRNNRNIRILLYKPPPFTESDRVASATTPVTLKPLHLDIHGGGFISGHPEANHRFCSTLSDRLDTIVISTTYRFAPRYGFPCAIEDVDDVVDWLVRHAEAELGADMGKFTVGGSSAGGNLALATCLRGHVKGRVKGVVTFYAPINVSIPPTMKPKPPGFPKRDPASFLLPLFDCYGRSACAQGMAEDPRSSPYFAPVEQLPEKILMVVPSIDILVAEQLEFAERVNGDCEKLGRPKKVEVMFMNECFHGWLELPDFAIPKLKNTRPEVFDRCTAFLRAAQKQLADAEA